MKRLFLAAAVLATVAAIFLWRQLPPKEQTLASAFSDETVAGVIHVHSSRSDGRGTPEQIAHDGARAGLKFIVLTDHGDGTRTPDPPIYREGVLCIDGTEISTRDGHYIAVDMAASPYPLGGDARDVVDDVKRLGGFGIVAHPDSPKPELAWKAWNAPFDAVEVLNLDTMWRRRLAEPGWRGKVALQARLLTYAIRPVESIASLVLGSTALEQWASVARRRHVVMLAGADAHAQIAWRASDPISAGFAIPVPSYLSIFRAMSIRVHPERPLTGDAKMDFAIVMRALRGGHLYTAVDGIATPPAIELTATNSLGTVRMGDQLDVAGPVTLHVRSNAPDGFATTVWNGAAPLTGRTERDFTVELPEGPGVYWVEVRPGGKRAAMPWVTTNPIYVRASGPPPGVLVKPAATTTTALFDGRTTTNWEIYHDATSLGAVDVAATESGENALRLRFGLANGPPANQYVALGVQTPRGIAADDRLEFAVRAQQPMRISVQLQTEQARWERSVYVDIFSQPHTIFFDEFRLLEGPAASVVPLADVRRILFVIDTTNTKPGASGRLWITAPALQR